MEFNKLIKIIIFIFPLFCFASNNVTISVEGTAIIEKKGKEKNDALNDAFESAVRIALRGLYSPSLIKKNEDKLRLKIYNRAKSLISEYVIKSETRNNDVFKIKVDVVINTKNLNDRLTESGIVLKELGMITKILPLIVEKTSNNDGDYWWKKSSDGLEQHNHFTDVEEALVKYFSEKGYFLINPYEHELSNRIPQAFRYMQIKAPELISVARMFGADIVGTGYVWSQCNRKELLDIVECKTNFSLQLLSKDTGKIIAAKKITDTFLDANYNNARTISRARATKTVADAIINQLTQKWNKRSGYNYRVILSNVNNYQIYKNFRDILISGKIQGLKNPLDRIQFAETFVFEGERTVDSQELVKIIYTRFSAENKIEIKARGEDFVELKVL